MSMTEPKDLMDVLSRLEDSRQHPTIETQRRYRRFSIRGDARLEPMDETPLFQPINILLRDISRGGIGFLVDRFIEPCTYWRLRFMNQGYVVGNQPVCVRFCRLVEENLYIAGGQFIVEPYLMSLVGVPDEELRGDDLCKFSDHDVSTFMPPESVEE